MSAEPRAAVNASPLIFLGKIDRLGLLPDPVGTTPIVLEEIRAADPVDHPEVDLVDTLVREGRIRPLEAAPEQAPNLGGFHEGEASVLALTAQEGFEQVIVDDKVAIRAAKLIGLEPVSTPFLLLRRVREGQLSTEGFRRSLDALLEHRYHLSADLYNALLDAAEPG